MSRLLDQVRAAIRTRHYSPRTEESYVAWIRRYIEFHQRRHPAVMGAAEVGAFLSHLAVSRQVSASTQNQALSAILFLYREVLGQDLPWLDDVVRAKKLTNVRAAGKDDSTVVRPVRRLTLEAALEWVGADELVEVTPESIRVRKRVLSETDRKREARKAKSS